MANDNKCAHESCNCSIQGDDQYCSDHCKQAAAQDMTEIMCDCGHDCCP